VQRHLGQQQACNSCSAQHSDVLLCKINNFIWSD
jgi:hypothetical protein